ncbi:hypothetical protein [Anaplasma phagocytophilum]|uniref:glycine-rich domain-containing protein n=1 Tax=Anaplasma phagocytophilum TaxID=948 RepID=UPI00200C8C85|nr:hypothetical protein [Anaplasma phagocytophilum]UQD54404.1 hypothetical protein ESP60_03475 [Anaplasma phagocytophilum]
MNVPNRVTGAISAGLGVSGRFEKLDNKNGDSGGMFEVPRIEVGIGNDRIRFWYSLERWEYQSPSDGNATAVAYVKRDSDGQLKLCACSRYTQMIPVEMQNEAARMRLEKYNEITNYADLSFDKKIEKECLYDPGFLEYVIYHGCVPIDSSTPAVPGFCNVFARDVHMKALPMEFSKQSYFVPGLRVLRVKNPSSGQPDQKISVYIGNYDGDTGTITGINKYVKCEKNYFSKDPQSCAVSVSNASDSGYSVMQSGDGVCLSYNSQGRRSVECVPSPELPDPAVSNSDQGLGLRIRFSDCYDKRDNKPTKYCDFTMMPGERDKEFGFSVTKPKLNKDKYELEEELRCLDKDGNVSSDKNSRDCTNSEKFYVEDQSSNVTCFSPPNNATKQFYVKRGDRYHWIRELEKVLVASSFQSEQQKYAQCPDSQSIDLAKLRQEDIDKLKRMGRGVYSLPSIGDDFRSKGKVLCRDNISYQYDNNRAFPHKGVCSARNSVGVLEGYCKTRYKSLDNFRPIFLQDDGETAEDVIPLNPIFQGMCVSNFPSHEYVYGEQEGDIVKKGDGYVEYVLEIGEKNATCDFLKIEMWGAGAAGSLSSGAAGKQGEYVMGLLKPDLKNVQYLSIKVGKGGIASAAHDDAKKSLGSNTLVSLCDDFNAMTCTMELGARGGGQSEKIATKGTSTLMHYRVSEGLTEAIGQSKVYTPYHGPYQSSGVLDADEAGCIRDPNDKSNNTQVVAPSSFPGTGGCARSDINVVQDGAHGRVKITCEQWSGAVGNIKKWRANLVCDQKMLKVLKELGQQADSVDISDATQKFFQEISTEQFCNYIADSPLFSNAVKRLANMEHFSTWYLIAAQEHVRYALFSLEEALNREKKVLKYEGIKPSNIADSQKRDHKKDDILERKEIFLSSFKELLSKSKVSVVDQRYDQLWKDLSIEAKKQGKQLHGIFEILSRKGIRKIDNNSELLSYLKSLLDVFRGHKPFLSIRDIADYNLMALLRGESGVLEAYEKEYASAQAMSPSSAHYMEVFEKELREVIDSAQCVSNGGNTSERGWQELLDVLSGHNKGKWLHLGQLVEVMNRNRSKSFENEKFLKTYLNEIANIIEKGKSTRDADELVSECTERFLRTLTYPADVYKEYTAEYATKVKDASSQDAIAALQRDLVKIINDARSSKLDKSVSSDDRLRSMLAALEKHTKNGWENINGLVGSMIKHDQKYETEKRFLETYVGKLLSAVENKEKDVETGAWGKKYTERFLQVLEGHYSKVIQAYTEAYDNKTAGKTGAGAQKAREVVKRELEDLLSVVSGEQFKKILAALTQKTKGKHISDLFKVMQRDGLKDSGGRKFLEGNLKRLLGALDKGEKRPKYGKRDVEELLRVLQKNYPEILKAFEKEHAPKSGSDTQDTIELLRRELSELLGGTSIEDLLETLRDFTGGRWPNANRLFSSMLAEDGKYNNEKEFLRSYLGKIVDIIEGRTYGVAAGYDVIAQTEQFSNTLQNHYPQLMRMYNVWCSRGARGDARSSMKSCFEAYEGELGDIFRWLIEERFKKLLDPLIAKTKGKHLDVLFSLMKKSRISNPVALEFYVNTLGKLLRVLEGEQSLQYTEQDVEEFINLMQDSCCNAILQEYENNYAKKQGSFKRNDLPYGDDITEFLARAFRKIFDKRSFDDIVSDACDYTYVGGWAYNVFKAMKKVNVFQAAKEKEKTKHDYYCFFTQEYVTRLVNAIEDDTATEDKSYVIEQSARFLIRLSFKDGFWRHGITAGFKINLFKEHITKIVTAKPGAQ